MTAVSTAPNNGIDRLATMIGTASRQTSLSWFFLSMIFKSEIFFSFLVGLMGSEYYHNSIVELLCDMAILDISIVTCQNK